MKQGSDTRFSAERRRFPRYLCTGNVEIFQGGRRWGWGKIDEISLCGCYIETTHPLPGGTQTQLRLNIADISLNIGASVICTTPQVGMGMDFVVEFPGQRNLLAQMIEEVKGALLPSAMLPAWENPEQANHAQAALEYLHQAQKELHKAAHDEAGHRTRALQLTRNAIDELNEARKWGSTIGRIVPASVMSKFGLSHEVQ